MIYLFKCSKCGYRDVELPISDCGMEHTCPCGRKMVKQFVMAGVVYKGKGWASKDTHNPMGGDWPDEAPLKKPPKKRA
jgi:putative FmdB family regulatory protein